MVTALFVDRTTDGLLVRKLREVEERLSKLTKYIVKIVERNGITLSPTLIQRDPFKGWACCRECGVCMWKPEQNKEENCNLQNVIFKGICTTCEDKEDERLRALQEENSDIKK